MDLGLLLLLGTALLTTYVLLHDGGSLGPGDEDLGSQADAQTAQGQK